MRKFALVVLNERDIVEERYNIDIVADPTGLGFSLKIETIKTDITEILVKATQELKEVKINVIFSGGNEYTKAKALRYWIERYTKKRMALEWTNETGIYYADCIVKNFEFSEIKEDQTMTIPITIKMLSPFFEVVEEEIKIFPSKGGKKYPYSYPYGYGSGVIANNIIVNNYIQPIPMIITIYGNMISPSVGIKEKGQAREYSQVSFPDLTLTDDQYIIINAVTNKIKYFNGVDFEDGYNYIDPTKDSFIFAKENTISEIEATVQSDKTGRLSASYRKYRL